MTRPSIDWGCFAWNLRDFMSESGLSMRDVQRLSGVDKSVIARVTGEQKDWRCRPEAYLALCQMMGANPTYFFTPANELEQV